MTETKKWKPLEYQCPLRCTYCPEEGEEHSEKPRLRGDWRNIPHHFAIWVSGDTDLFCEEVPNDLINSIMRAASEHPDKCFIFCTKNPGRYFDFIDKFPPWTILATTVESDIDYNCSRAPPPMVRLEELRKLRLALGDFSRTKTVAISIQPIMTFTDNFVGAIRRVMPDQVGIGREVTNLLNFPEPPFQDVIDLARALSRFTTALIQGDMIMPSTSLKDWPDDECPERFQYLLETPRIFRRYE